MTPVSRRAFLGASAGTLATAWLTADVARLLASGEHAARAGNATPPPAFEYFSPGDAADVEAAASQIIPTDDTPGATEAHVVHFIDHALASWQKDQREAFVRGIAELRKRARGYRAETFAALNETQRHAVIAALEKDGDPFFHALRASTIVGLLANPEYRGNHEKTGWKLIGFADQFSWAPPFGWYDANVR